MADETTVAPAAPSTVEAATPELNPAFLSDDKLASIFGNEDASAATSTATAETVPAVGQAAEAAPAVEVPGEFNMSALDEDKPEATAPNVPAATPDSEYVQLVKQVLPNRETLGWAVDAFQRTTQAAQAAQSGNVEAALTALPFMKPLLEKAIANHVAVNEQQIIEAFIRKNSPETHNPEMDQLKQELAEIKQHLTSGQRQAQAAREQEALQGRTHAMDTEVTSLLDRANFTKNEADRKIVSRLVKVAVAESQPVYQQVMAGDLKSLRSVLKGVLTDYVAADKAKAAPVQGKQPLAPILTGAGSAVSNDTPDVWAKSMNKVLELQRAGK